MNVIDFPRHPRVRYFDFDRDVTIGEATRAIIAALNDEGYTLSVSDNAKVSAVTTVIVDGVKRVVVPGHRIIKLGESS